MEFLKQIWSFLDGRKTLIGGYLLIAGDTIKSGLSLGEGLPSIPSFPALAPLSPWIMLAGTLLAGGGGIHKIIKARLASKGVETDTPAA